jgi:FMN phosphatase YigB (HAD superfamily)
MDSIRTGETFFGKKVLSEEEIVAAKAKKIIIAARRSNIMIIYRRIERFCLENNIEVYDITGERYPNENADKYDFSAYAEVTADNLKKKIDNADVVSFDIFDTLLIRKKLIPTDVFYFGGEDFAKARILAERQLYAEGKNPTIFDIYNGFPSEFTPEDEIKAELKTLLPRTEVIKCLEYAKSCGKEVFVTSDMYYPKAEMKRLLSANGIEIPLDNILVSCDYGFGKWNGLFDILKEKNPGRRILHIGDNVEADIEAAKRYGIDDTFYIPSVYKMLEDSFAKEVLSFSDTPENREMIGLFAAGTLNNPFLFAKTGGKFSSDSVYEMAYTFIAPLVWSVFCGTVKIAEEENIKTVLLGARDGYLLSEIYKQRKGRENLPIMHYFLISRALAVFAALKSEDDIIEAMKLPFSGLVDEMLRVRFGIETTETPEKDESEGDFVLRFSKDILKNAENARKRYLEYIKKFDLSGKIGFFDCVSSGTCQNALAEITGFDLTGIYIIGVLYTCIYKKEPIIKAVFGMANPFKKDYNIMENYLLLENVLSSQEPTIIGFGSDLSPIFMEDLRTETQLRNLTIIQKAILDYTENFELSAKKSAEINIRIADLLYSYIKPDCFEDKSGYFTEEILYDEFCKRRFGVSF